MALLKKDGDKNDTRGGAVEAALSIISAGMRITGDLETNGTLKIDGRIEGSVVGARQLMLGRTGAIHGNIRAGEVVVGGLVDGAIVADDRLELQNSAVVNGDIDTKSIVVLEGARINGSVRMQDGPTSPDSSVTSHPTSGIH
jgi:cytoskeletal protein CcmA (bactofilin family)